jgi:DNA-binding CsgD family transcriptional regulator
MQHGKALGHDATDPAGQFAEAPDRTLILGLDGTGRIVDHDRLAAGLINGVRESLLGIEFASLIADPLQAESFRKHLDAVRSGRDITMVVNAETAWTVRAEAVITLQPVSSSTGLMARMIVRIKSPAEGRFADTQVMQHALLDAPISRTGGGLGIDEVAPALTGVVVPHFCSAHRAATLTAAELRLLPLLSTHLTFPEIAAELFLSYNTIKSQTLSLYRKLGASSRNQAVTQARALGLIETSGSLFTFSGDEFRPETQSRSIPPTRAYESFNRIT